MLHSRGFAFIGRRPAACQVADGLPSARGLPMTAGVDLKVQGVGEMVIDEGIAPRRTAMHLLGRADGSAGEP